MAADFGWTLLVFGGVLLGMFAILQFANYIFHIKPGRWAFFRLALLIGIVYSAAVVLISDYSKESAPQKERHSDVLSFKAGPVFPEPTSEQMQDAFRSIYGAYLYDEDFLNDVEILNAENKRLTRENISLRSAASGGGVLPQEIAQSFLELTSRANDGDLCSFVGAEYWQITEKRPLWRGGDRKLFAGLKAREEPIILFQKLRNAENAVWGLAHCGHFKGQAWCADRTLELGGPNTETSRDFRDKYGCNDPIEKIAQAEAILSKAVSDAVAETVKIEIPDTKEAEQRKLSFREALAVFSLLDAYISDRTIEVFDRVIISTGEAIASEILSTDIPVTTDNLSWHQSVCVEKKNEFPWCRSVGRTAARIVLSPNLLQGVVISLYLSIFLMVFKRRRDRKLAAIDWSGAGKEIWEMKNGKSERQTRRLFRVSPEGPRPLSSFSKALFDGRRSKLVLAISGYFGLILILVALVESVFQLDGLQREFLRGLFFYTVAAPAALISMVVVAILSVAAVALIVVTITFPAGTWTPLGTLGDYGRAILGLIAHFIGPFYRVESLFVIIVSLVITFSMKSILGYFPGLEAAMPTWLLEFYTYIDTIPGGIFDSFFGKPTETTVA